MKIFLHPNKWREIYCRKPFKKGKKILEQFLNPSSPRYKKHVNIYNTLRVAENLMGHYKF